LQTTRPKEAWTCLLRFFCFAYVRRDQFFQELPAGGELVLRVGGQVTRPGGVGVAQAVADGAGHFRVAQAQLAEYAGSGDTHLGGVVRAKQAEQFLAGGVEHGDSREGGRAWSEPLPL
jgi:hypothetical protein